ncbi:4-hydroxy-tetrahydrodipicolinate reductase [Duganella sp. CT11-25]|uniref:4-hydroxy-tetrahydrodipicolinate reductase n=1 Tax=Duganella sp. CT11-25 TaxID=3243027 RepID=UPI0039B0F2F0
MSKQTMRLVVAGAAGRMGRMLIRQIVETDGLGLHAALVRPGSPWLGQDAGTLAGLAPAGVPASDDVAAALAGADCILDFSTPAAAARLAAAPGRCSVAHVIGTTGFTPEQERRLARAAQATALVVSGNMSPSVILLGFLAGQAARALPAADWDIEILEMHHKHKVDAPSGTALLLGEAAARGRGQDLRTQAVLAREGQTGARRAGAIGFATLRGGSVVGEHTVLFAGDGETLALSHSASDRLGFVRGALQAAHWTRGRPPGRYSMLDVLGLPQAPAGG